MVTLRSDTGNTGVSPSVGEACLYSSYSKRGRRANPLPASSAPAIYRQYMKYGSYLVEGENVQGFYFLCVMFESEWDGNDCLWDYGGMRNHHKSNLFMLPAVLHMFSWPDYCICDCNHCWLFLPPTSLDLFPDLWFPMRENKYENSLPADPLGGLGSCWNLSTHATIAEEFLLLLEQWMHLCIRGPFWETKDTQGLRGFFF